MLYCTRSGYNRSVKKILLAAIRWYKNTEPVRTEMARAIGLTTNTCRFKPTCSEYMYDAVEKYGSVRGFVLGIKRIVRCGPWSKGGWDPVR